MGSHTVKVLPTFTSLSTKMSPTRGGGGSESYKGFIPRDQKVSLKVLRIVFCHVIQPLCNSLSESAFHTSMSLNKLLD